MNRRKVKVVWEEVCVPKEEGRLSLIKIKDWYKTFMIRHVWNLNLDTNCSLWVDWI